MSLECELDAVRFVVAIRGDRITVAHYDDEPDYGVQVAATFRRFPRRPEASHPSPAGNWDTYAATGVLDLVAKLHPELFATLDAFCAQSLDYLDPTIRAFDRDIHFYIAYLAYITPLRNSG